MSFKGTLRICSAALCAVTACTSALCGEPHQNFILLMPHSLPASIVDPIFAPNLIRLRAEGVYLIDSHTDLPAHIEADRFASNARSLAQAAADNYSVGLVEDVQAEPSSLRPQLNEDRRRANLNKVLHVLLPRFKDEGRPFLLVYRVATPDYIELQPADNSIPARDDEGPPAGMLGVLTVDDTLAAIEAALESLGLYHNTNIVVAAEHGSSTVWKDSDASVSREFAGKKRPRDSLPPGFLAIDIVDALQKVDGGLSLFDPDDTYKLVAYTSGGFPSRGNAVIAVDPSDPFATVEARGGYDLIYLPESLPKEEARRRAQLIAEAFFEQDYFGGLFVDEATVGRTRGALSIKHLGWDDTFAKKPTMVVNFVSVSTSCDRPMLCTLVVADTPLAEGEQIQSALNRAETWNFIAARGPAFRTRFVSDVPASNADVVMTLAHLLHVDIGSKRHRNARLLTEGLRGHEEKRAPRKREQAFASKASAIGEVAEAGFQVVAQAKYFDAGGLGGWTVGIPPRPEPVEWRPWRWDWPRPNGFSINIAP